MRHPRGAQARRDMPRGPRTPGSVIPLITTTMRNEEELKGLSLLGSQATEYLPTTTPECSKLSTTSTPNDATW